MIGHNHLELARALAADKAPDARYIVEPLGRNTAPAIALAAHALGADDIMLVCPSDHHIRDDQAFVEAAQRAAELARDDWLVAFGIEATAPETGYGYIRRGEPLKGGYRIRNFVEKPDRETALRFLADGDYAWNGGIFAFRAGNFLTELQSHRPDLSKKAEAAFRAAGRQGSCIYPDSQSFAAIAGESVDYAVMESTDRAAMVSAAMGWSDIGTWEALLQKRDADERGNVIVGNGEIVDASGTMVDSDGPFVTVIGASDIVVVVDGNDILVTARGSAQHIAKASRCGA